MRKKKLEFIIQKLINSLFPQITQVEKNWKIFRSNCQYPLAQRKSKRVPEKISTSASLTMPKPLTVWITTDYGNFFKTWEYQTTLPDS